jgi:hypothetical protein
MLDQIPLVAKPAQVWFDVGLRLMACQDRSIFSTGLKYFRQFRGEPNLKETYTFVFFYTSATEIQDVMMCCDECVFFFSQRKKRELRMLSDLALILTTFNPGNILVNEAGMPVLIDFGSSHLIGKKLTTSRGTKGWIDEDIKDYTTSKKRHDISALCKIRAWLDEPTIKDQLALCVL